MKIGEKNVGTTDRAVRIMLGIVAFAAGYLYLAAPISYIAYLFGLILLVTGALGTCTIYSLLGMNTLEKKKK